IAHSAPPILAAFARSTPAYGSSCLRNNARSRCKGRTYYLRHVAEVVDPEPPCDVAAAAQDRERVVGDVAAARLRRLPVAVALVRADRRRPVLAATTRDVRPVRIARLSR